MALITGRLAQRAIRLIVASAAGVALALMAMTWPSGKGSAAAQEKKPTSDQVFKNVQVLKGTSVDDFLGTMGIMCASLGMDCADCHVGAGTEKVDWAADTPRKVMARKMVRMVQTINHDNFSGRQMVTCWSCHRGRDRPLTTPTLANMYGPAPEEQDDFLMPTDQPSADQIIDKYLQAVGGQQRLSTLKSFVASGSSVGFGGFGRGGRVQVFSRFPDQRAIIIDFPSTPERGHNLRIFDGRQGWIETPLSVLGKYEITGGELDGAKLDAELAFPAQIRQALSNLHAATPTTISDLPEPSSQAAEESKTTTSKEHAVNVVQGMGPGGMLATLYFDTESGYLLREVRYSKSPIGRIPTQIDYSDYRDVGGIKMPFRLVFGWLDGRDSIQLDKIQLNAAIDPSKFSKPAEERAK
ncbi:MAG TPA: photosynthetic reaction center cytochrome c subunit family protein [Candidatus Angelobacter sp.]|nr:photosynthetic reaction center cytochrome c subunit family protein [Candidatus Angelobacter sp.]